MMESVPPDSKTSDTAHSQTLLSSTYEIINMIRQYGIPDAATADLYAQKISMFYALKKRLFSFFNIASKP